MVQILIIDDNVQLRRTLVRTLKAAGHDVHEAADGVKGLKLFEELRPDLIITDIVMPEQEGIETIRLLRQRAPNLPIIAISGGGRLDYLGFARELGATATLPKPFGSEELLAAVADVLAHAEQPPPHR